MRSWPGLIAASLKPASQVFDNSLIPHTWKFSNYVDVWHELPLLHWVFNSVSIALLAAGFVAVSSSIVAFGFAYFRFPGRNFLFGLVLATMMLPASVTMIPTYLIWKQTGLLGTWVPLFGANLFGSAFYIFLQRQFYLGLPRELFEAARVDGASSWHAYRRITLPLLRPAFLVALVINLMNVFNSFPIIWAMTHGQPGYSTTTTTVFMYILKGKDLGESAAMSVVNFGLVVIIVGLFLKISRWKAEVD